MSGSPHKVFVNKLYEEEMRNGGAPGTSSLLDPQGKGRHSKALKSGPKGSQYSGINSSGGFGAGGRSGSKSTGPYNLKYQN